jgi:uncharacterized protein YdeI (YjbR/CyaY-like superfamily)
VTAEQPEPLMLRDAAAWRAWLARNGATSTGVWLVLAKKGTSEPTRLTYDEALDEALCQGWIDGQVKSIDARVYRQRFTPRRPRSTWSARNVGIVARLTAEGRMQPAGVAAVEAAQADGRWAAAYGGRGAIAVPDDLADALRANPAAQQLFDELDPTNRFAVLFRVVTAHRPETRARRVATLVERLGRGETPHPRPDAPARDAPARDVPARNAPARDASRPES